MAVFNPGTGGYYPPPPPPDQYTPNGPFTVGSTPPIFSGTSPLPGQPSSAALPVPGVVAPGTPESAPTPYTWSQADLQALIAAANAANAASTQPPPTTTAPDSFITAPPPPPIIEGPPVEPKIPEVPPVEPPPPPPPPPPTLPEQGLPVAPIGFSQDLSQSQGPSGGIGGAGFNLQQPGGSGFRPQVPMWARGLQQSPFGRFMQQRNPTLGLPFSPEAPAQDPEELRRRQEAMAAQSLPDWALPA